MTDVLIRPAVTADVPAVKAVCEVVERRADGPYDRIHYRKRLNSPPMG
ncbi:hypothetical protein [Streptomyces sp. NBC_00094]|nr:hypothetical protein [Streptomyces sp. NBC_00094]MCX5389784.1 hypothetical protein [Streptomyces sp. NBC_00094]